MKTFAKLFLLTAVLAVGVALFTAKPSHAAPRWLASVTSTDGGAATQALDLRTYPKSRLCLVPTDTRTCFRTGWFDGGNPPFSPDCTKDMVIAAGQSGEARQDTFCVDVGGKSVIVFANLDAGAATTKVFVDELNPVRY